MTTLFISDLHFGHANILKFNPETRPFSTIEEMDEAIIARWQEQVASNDTVYILGDMFFHKAAKSISIMKRLPGRKHIILGNHDKVIRDDHDLLDMFASASEYKEIKIGGRKIVMFHFPIWEWNAMHYGSYQLHGHTHGNFTHPGRCVDVGVDGPLSKDLGLVPFEDIEAYMKDRPILTHHGKYGDNITPLVPTI
jgi:calcineurin-like phosphoesterase family protein